MKAINITEVFCEVLSGVAILCLIIPILDVCEVVGLQDTWSFILTNVSDTNAALAVVFCYILGLIMNAIGLAFGEIFLDDLVQKCNEPSTGNDEDFWQNVEAHVLQARNTNWEYYSTFRNLFILLIPGMVLWSWSICRVSNVICTLVVIIAAILIEIALFWAMKTLMKVHCEITENASAASGTS